MLAHILNRKIEHFSEDFIANCNEFPNAIQPEKLAHYASCKKCFRKLNQSAKDKVANWRRKQAKNALRKKRFLTELRDLMNEQKSQTSPP